jgi:uncharacterized protein YdeI (YjbR/CyaY-like superfamily)
MTQDIDTYLSDGCGRCQLFGTPQCKVRFWTKELAVLRHIVLDCLLTEEMKWGSPCYTYQGANIAMIGAFKEYLVLSFFKGALLQDAEGLLSKPGENSHEGRLFRFTKLSEIQQLEPLIKAYLFEAVEVEKAGLKVPAKPLEEYKVPAELQQKLDEDPGFQAAFEALTPGRRKGYLLFFSAPKQAKTREARIEKCLPQIFAGKGMYD